MPGYRVVPPKKSTLSEQESNWYEGASSLLLLASAQVTGLVDVLPQIVPEVCDRMPQRLAESGETSRQQLLQTLLFMPVADVFRPYDLRRYSGDSLSLLSGRSRAFGYVHTERFLSQLARVNGNEEATRVLSAWISDLWEHDANTIYYVDGHRKPVYSDVRLPRGLIGRTGKVLGARTLTLLNDDQGHPLLITTARGDQHLTVGLPDIMQRYTPHLMQPTRPKIVVDRECMAAGFLQTWHEQFTFITLLKSNQYQDVDSFTQVGDFIPLITDKQGEVLQDVADACFALNVPDQDEGLKLAVALIRDYQRPVLLDPPDWSQVARFDRPWADFTDTNWQPQPTPATPTAPKLIPIVSTRPVTDATTLVSLYRQRWSAQENVIKDFLLPLGLDVNHGYAKQQIENSEFHKQYDALQDKAQRLDRWRKSALKRSDRASRRHNRLRQATNTFSHEQYRILNNQWVTLDPQQPDYHTHKAQLQDFKRDIDAEVKRQSQQVWKAYHQCNDEFQKAKRYARQQCEIQRALLDLEAQLCDMFELDNRKDQLMSMFNIALTNLIMWTRDTFFPDNYAHATWKTLQPFFRLPGRIEISATTCTVTLRSFNDLALKRDLIQLCQTVNDAQLKSPAGLKLQFRVIDYD